MRFAFREDSTKPWVHFDSVEELRALPVVKKYAAQPLAIFRGKAFEGTFFLYRQDAPTNCEYVGQLLDVDGLELPECVPYNHVCWQITFPGEKLVLLPEYRKLAPPPWYVHTHGASWGYIFDLIWVKLKKVFKRDNV